jgi:hypothetical protein
MAVVLSQVRGKPGSVSWDTSTIQGSMSLTMTIPYKEKKGPPFCNKSKLNY